MSYKEPDPINSVVSLKVLLTDHGIKTDNFGRGKAKTIDDLLKELESGETKLVEQKGKLVRVLDIAGVNIYFDDESHRYRLVQEKQVFADGRTRPRQTLFSVSEKNENR